VVSELQKKALMQKYESVVQQPEEEPVQDMRSEEESL
jgi:hypothetical protein